MKKILVVLLLMSIAMLSGCVTRLPERQALAPSAIPNLNEGNARGVFCIIEIPKVAIRNSPLLQSEIPQFCNEKVEGFGTH